jgi:hypothetical protein
MSTIPWQVSLTLPSRCCYHVISADFLALGSVGHRRSFVIAARIFEAIEFSASASDVQTSKGDAIATTCAALAGAATPLSNLAI